MQRTVLRKSQNVSNRLGENHQIGIQYVLTFLRDHPIVFGMTAKEAVSFRYDIIFELEPSFQEEQECVLVCFSDVGLVDQVHDNCKLVRVYPETDLSLTH